MWPSTFFKDDLHSCGSIGKKVIKAKTFKGGAKNKVPLLK